MENFDERGKQNSDASHNARNMQGGSNERGQGRFNRSRNHPHQVRSTNFRESQGYNQNRPYSSHDGGQRGQFTSPENTGTGMHTRNNGDYHEGLNPRADPYDPNRNDTSVTCRGRSSEQVPGNELRTM
ncbi:hypothetical protein L798_08175 [Zootermopsis nevadensis]|uniref:Uncharacterized protein n=1 Tax=Zootermopsis nevadensis TaxID=136037 RepID=A0A067RG05_ZOONE|nr:hypothetical protein L798_08175 [Zootermopsis nevadensis]